jgi:hypothetical protein
MLSLLFFCSAKRKVTKEKAALPNALRGAKGSAACYVELRSSIFSCALVSCLPLEYPSPASISTSFITFQSFSQTGKGAVLVFSSYPLFINLVEKTQNYLLSITHKRGKWREFSEKRPGLSGGSHIQINGVKSELKRGVNCVWVVNRGVLLPCSQYFLLFLKL